MTVSLQDGNRQVPPWLDGRLPAMRSERASRVRPAGPEPYKARERALGLDGRVEFGQMNVAMV